MIAAQAMSARPPSFAPREWRWVLMAALLVALIASIPWLAGSLAQTDELVFLGAIYDVQDYHAHLARMQLGALGEGGYRGLFTSEQLEPARAAMAYIWLGATSAQLGLPLALTYQAFRVLGGIVLVFSAYWFIGLFTPGAASRRLGLMIAFGSSGLGWLLISHPAFSAPNVSPIDFWLADAYLLFSIMGFGHFGWAISAGAITLGCWWLFAERGDLRSLLPMLLATVVHTQLQVFELAVVDGVVMLDLLRRALVDRQTLRRTLLAGTLLLLAQLVTAWPSIVALRTHPQFQQWALQNQLRSPAVQYYLLGYGLLWILLLSGIFLAARRRKQLLPLLWLAVAALLVYAPSAYQFRWLAGVQIPMGSLAALGWEAQLRPWLARRRKLLQTARGAWWLNALMLVALMPSNLYLIGGNALLATTHWEAAFISRSEAEAIDWLALNAGERQVTMASLKIGNAIAGRAGRPVYLGHWVETMFFAEKSVRTAAFYNEMRDDERQALLVENNIHFVYFGPQERQLGDFDPQSAAYLTPRFEDGEVTIFQVHVR